MRQSHGLRRATLGSVAGSRAGILIRLPFHGGAGEDVAANFHCVCGHDLDSHVRQDGCDEEGCHCRKFKVVWDDEIQELVHA